MRVCAGLVVGLAFLVSMPSFAAEGIFEGTVVKPPSNQPELPGWIFVEGGNHLLRRVEVAHAVIVFDPDISPKRKGKCGLECLSAGQEVRVTADQDKSGEWRALRVEIVRDVVKRQSGLVAHGRVPKTLNFEDFRPAPYTPENARFPSRVPLRNLIEARMFRSTWITNGCWPSI